MSTASSTPAVAGFSRALLAAGLLIAAGCTSVRSTEATFDGTRWQVTSLNGREVPATHMYSLSFDGDRIAGRFGCNQFGGTYRVEKDRLIAGNVASTLIGCPEPAATHEAQGFLVLAQPMQIDWESDDEVTLSNGAGSIGLELRP